MSRETTFKVTILRRRGEARQAATPQNNRFYRIFEELPLSASCRAAVHDEAFAGERCASSS
jgi:hypothetical protein